MELAGAWREALVALWPFSSVLWAPSLLLWRSQLAMISLFVFQLVEYDKQCCVFLERMRHSTSFEMVQKFKSFVNDFVGTQHTSADQCSEAVHSFIEVCSVGSGLASQQSSQLCAVMVWCLLASWADREVEGEDVQGRQVELCLVMFPR